MVIIPVEMFACTYNEGKGASDLDDVTAKWNKWADENGTDDYSAWTLTPYYFGSEQDFDVIWLGAAKNAVALGRAQDTYIAEDAGLRAEFEEVLSCDAHVNFASVNYKALPDGRTPQNSVLTFSDCSYKEGATFDQLSAAMDQWAQHLSDAGSTTGIFHWYPMYGGGKEEFDFKWLQAFDNLTALGADYDNFGNGGAWRVRMELLSPLISCDGSRAYLAENRRYTQLR